MIALAKRIGCLCALLTALPSFVAAASWDPIENLPGTRPASVEVNGKSRHYFRVSPGTPLSIALQGPGRLRVVSRAELPEGANRVVSYRVLVAEGDRVLKEQPTESSPASGARLEGNGGVLCKSRSMIVDVPEGSHRVSLSVSGPPSVLVRLLFAAPLRDKTQMISITPVDAARSVTVSEGEKLIPYYSALPGKPVRLRVVGPASLELTTRLDFDSTMRGVQAYRLSLSRSGRRFREVAFKTTKSTTARYTDLQDRVPSKLDRVVLPIGDGTQDLSVELIEPRKGSVEIHARIPQPSVGNEE